MTITTFIDSDGDIFLGTNSSEPAGFELLDNTTTPDPTEVVLTRDGSAVTIDDVLVPDYTLIHAEKSDLGGYTLLFRNGETYQTWAVNGSGLLSVDGPASIDVVVAEETFNVLLNDDGFIGEPPAVTNTLSDNGTDGAAIGVSDAGQYVVIDPASDPTTGIGITLNGAPVQAAFYEDLGWAMTQAVAEVDSATSEITGYKVLFEQADGRVTTWTLDASGARTGTEVVSGDAAVWAEEVVFQADIDGDEEIGTPPPSAITLTNTLSDNGTDGAAIGVNDAGQYFVIDPTSDPLTGTGIKVNGEPVQAAFYTDRGWAMTQAVAEVDSATSEITGYKVLFEQADGRVTTWTLDASGERTAVEVVSGDAAVWAEEVVFQADIDGDEEIGTPPPSAITLTNTLSDNGTDGAAIGVSDAGQYFVIDPTSDPLTGTGIKVNGEPVQAAFYTDRGWAMTQAVAEVDSATSEITGYKVLFEQADGRVTTWTLDASGERTAVEVVSGDAAVWAEEVVFQADIDGDEEIGTPPPSAITLTNTLSDNGTDGAAIGVSDAGQYFVIDPTSDPLTGTGIKVNGEPVQAAFYTDRGWAMTQAVAEVDSATSEITGYKVLFEQADGRVTTWTLDASGERTAVEVVSGDAAVWAEEVVFQADIDGDEEIGTPPPSTLTNTLSDNGTDGAAIGVNDAGQYFVIDPTSDPLTGTGIKVNGEPVQAAFYTDRGWAMTQAVAEVDSATSEITGYKVLFEQADGRVTTWTLDASGERTAVEVVSGDAAVWAEEVVFQADIDGDEEIGTPPPSAITLTNTLSDNGTDGAAIGVNDAGQYFVIDPTSDPLTGTGIKVNGEPVQAAFYTDRGWAMTQAVAEVDSATSEITGYKVLFEQADGRVTTWTLDASGERTAVEVVSGDAAVWAEEVVFQADIDGDEEIGTPPPSTLTNTLSDNGTDGAAIGVNDAGQYFVIDPTSDPLTGTGIKVNGEPVQAAFYTDRGWAMTQAVAEVDSATSEITGYKVLFEQADGRVTTWTLDASGERTAVEVVSGDAAVWAEEVVFQADIDGDEEIGTPPPSTLTNTLSDNGTDGAAIGVNDAGQYFVIDPTSDPLTGTGIKVNGEPVQAAFYTDRGWAMTQAVAEVDSATSEITGYKVLFEQADGRVTLWTLDASGERTATEVVSGDGVAGVEFLFGVDLEGGLEVGPIESNGDVFLSYDDNGDYFVQNAIEGVAVGDASRLEVSVGVPETPIIDDTADTFVFTIVAAEEASGGADGYRVLWEGVNATGEVTDYFISNYDDQAVLLADEEDLSGYNIADLEFEFSYDLDDSVFAIA